jgi:uncharacterized RDD family membrane protein YckC
MSRKPATGDDLPLFVDLPLDLPGAAADDELVADEPADEPADDDGSVGGARLARRAPAPDAERLAVQTDLFARPLLSDDDGDAADAADDFAPMEPAIEGAGEPARLRDRCLGGLADLSVHGAVLGVVLIALWLFDLPMSRQQLPALGVFLLLFSWIYTVVPLAFWGQTPGMAWVGLASRADAGEPLTFGQTVRRWFGSLLTLGLAGLPVLLALRGGGSLADRISDTHTETTG